ncbi:MAG: outer membrane lipoprotein-sorting protein [Verrucomicrobia bacterium]|nr:outer membrane lipoprotein-sorting protein [Verrucomicrobiota bacterium]
MRQVKITIGRLLCAWAFSFFSFVNPALAQTDARAILDGIRVAQGQLHQELTGRLRLADGTAIPFGLRLEGNQLAYEFKDPKEVITLNLGETGSQLRDETKSGTQRLSGARLLQPVRNSDLTYEDISLRFIYWNRAVVEGEQQVKTLTCWMILVQPPPGESSQYGSVRLWVQKEGGALMRAEGFDRQRRPLKRFELVSGQKINGKWWLKQMRIERFDPQTQRVLSRTYLEINPPADQST